MRGWVVGFLVDPVDRQVVLIRKNRPEWMAGRLNGVGGKIEPGETPHAAMLREFREETGCLVGAWFEFVRLVAVSTEDRSGEITPDPGVIHFFASSEWSVTAGLRSATDEEVAIFPIDGLAAEHVVPNLLWLVPLAAHREDRYDVIDVTEAATTLRVSRG